jgi:TolA-binding protein
MRQLRGQIEVVANNIDVAAKRQRDMYVDLDSRLRRLEQPGSGAPPPSAPGSGAAPAPAASPSASASPDESHAYEAAQEQRRSGNYQGAIAAFQGFITQYPKSPLAARAQYWIGDSYYNLRDFRSAIANQQKLMSAYPDADGTRRRRRGQENHGWPGRALSHQRGGGEGEAPAHHSALILVFFFPLVISGAVRDKPALIV